MIEPRCVAIGRERQEYFVILTARLSGSGPIERLARGGPTALLQGTATLAKAGHRRPLTLIGSLRCCRRGMIDDCNYRAQPWQCSQERSCGAADWQNDGAYLLLWTCDGASRQPSAYERSINILFSHRVKLRSNIVTPSSNPCWDRLTPQQKQTPTSTP